jgi:predicted HicB family RNase H-like nuclease
MTTKTVFKNDLYTYRVTWSPEDEEYVGLCTEFPSLSWLAGSQEDAFMGIRNLVTEVISDMRANDEPIPEPLAAKEFKGFLSLRLTPERHKRIAMLAKEAKVSINRFVNDKLAD